MALQVITLAHDSDFETLADGAEQIYWSSSSTWGMSAGAAGVRMQVLLLTVTPHTRLQVIGQYSNDGRSWSDFVATLDGQSTPVDLMPSNGVIEARQYAGPPEEMAAFVRYGVKVWRTDGAQGRVRLSVDIIVLPQLNAARLWMASNQTVTVVSDVVEPPGQIGRVECTYGYDRGAFYIKKDALAEVTALTLVIETTYALNAAILETPSVWRTVQTVPALTTFGASAAYQKVEVSGLDAFTRVRATSATGTGDVNFDVDAFLRPAS